MALIHVLAMGALTAFAPAMLDEAPAPALHEAPAAASLDVSPGPLTAGGKATIEYSNPAKAGQEAYVEVSDGAYPVPRTQIVVIPLDANGNGVATWDVPSDWDGATFSAVGAPSVSRRILPPAGDQ